IREAGADLDGSETFRLAVGQSLNVTVTISPLISGRHVLELILNLPGALEPTGNRAADTVQVCYPFAALQINEFLAQPLDQQSEFIELTGDFLIDLSGWGFSDNSDQMRRLPGIELQPGDYLVLAPDSLLFPLLPAGGLFAIPINGWPALNNGGDAIFVYDPTGKIIDSLIYDESWPLQLGRSLEKLNPGDVSATSNNWSAAVNPAGMTPGAVNSLYLPVRPEKSHVQYMPNPFSPDGDGHEDLLRVSFQLQFELAIIKLELFDLRGRRIACPAWNRPVAQSGYLEWDGKRSDGERTRIGIYLARFSARDQTSGKTWEDVQTVVVAR
ncbi:MAG: lamin tail domain-containing protein, partial [Candidatus Neomarinimicrobiota bacterium]